MKMTLRQSLRDTALPIFLALWMALTPAFAGSMMLLGVGGGSATVGPITMSFVTGATLAGSSPNWTLTGASIGNPVYILTRRVYVTVVSSNSGVSAVLSGSTIGGVACDVALTVGNTNNASVYVYSAVVPTGTTANFNLVTSGVINLGRVRIYTADNSLISTPTPVPSYATTTSGTTLTASVATLAGGALLMASAYNGITTGTQNITASDSGMTRNDSFNISEAGVASNTSASAANHVTESWTTATTNGAMGLMAIR